MELSEQGKIIHIYDWMGINENYKNGVSNEQVLNRFGSEYIEAWKKLKNNKKVVFFENKKWHRWNN